MKIYVGNLPFRSTEEDLQLLFEQYGTVDSVRIILDRDSGRSRGFGFVEMGDSEGQSAIDALHGSDFQGRELTVNMARPRQ